MSEAGTGGAAGTHARLVRSRASLLRALAGVTEADFRRQVDGELLVERLAELARRERDAVASASALLAGAGQPAAALPVPERPAALPPQVIHALAGARHRSLRLLDELSASGASPGDEHARALALLDAVAEREERVASLLGGGP